MKNLPDFAEIPLWKVSKGYQAKIVARLKNVNQMKFRSSGSEHGMTRQEMEKVVQRQLEAYNRRDLKEFCSCYHPEVKIANLIAGQTTCSGIEQFQGIYRTLFDSSPKLHCELKSRIVLDTAVIDEEYVTGSARFPNGLHAVAVYGFRDGLIDRVWFPR